MLTEILTAMGFPAGARPPPRVGVSACLLGRPVRYDGEHKYDALVGGPLAKLLQLVEACPEVGIGLPVPRPPIQVVRLASAERVRGVQAPEQDFTDALSGYAERIDRDLDGFILKSRSPSCGLGSTPLHDAQDERIGTTSGAFAARLRQRLALLPMCNDEDLSTSDGAAAFVLEVFCYRHWKERGDLAGLRQGADALPMPLRGRLLTFIQRLDAAR